MESPAVSEKAVLDKFLADNPELEGLTARLATFNVFRALKIEPEEIRHSNTLAWLLDPRESHGLDDIVLRRILSNILLEAGGERSESLGISAAQVELMDLTDVEVRREWEKTDVLVIIRQPDDKGIVLLVENKIHSGEGEGQLNRYRERVSKEFSEFMLVPVFLTLEGEGADEDEVGAFIPYSHRQVRAVLERIIGQRRQQLPEAVAVFLDQYMDTLRRLTMEDNEVADLCKSIYRKHRAAIDLIVEYGRASKFKEVVIATLEKQGGFEVLSSNASAVWFLPITWARMIPENGVAWGHLSRPVSVACWLWQQSDRIKLTFEVSCMEEPKLRLACVTALRKAGFVLRNEAFRENATYSRFFNATRKVDDFNDEEEVRDVVDALVAKAKEQFPKAGAAFADVFGGK